MIRQLIERFLDWVFDEDTDYWAERDREMAEAVRLDLGGLNA